MFTWDINKNEINKKKHGISFEVAKTIFEDPLHTTWLDESKDTDTRWHTVGIIEGGVNCIISYNASDDNGEEIIRIISARKISKIEKKHFGICPDKHTSQVLGHNTSENFKGWFGETGYRAHKLNRKTKFLKRTN